MITKYKYWIKVTDFNKINILFDIMWIVTL